MSYVAVFLDRDDTIVPDPGYISSPDQVTLMPGVGEALAKLSGLGLKLVLVTNQSGIARGMLTEDDLEKIHTKLKRLLADHDVSLDAIYYCPYHPDGIVDEYKKESDMRKPEAGMLFKAATDMNIDLEMSWMVGNSTRDVEAGKKAKCKTILVKPPSSTAQILYQKDDADFVAINFTEAANIIRRHHREKPKQVEPEKPPQRQQQQQVEKNDMPTLIEKKIMQKLEETLDKPKPEEVKIKTKDKDQVPKKPDSDQVLLDILQTLKSMQRNQMFADFSAFKLAAYFAQAVAIILVVIAVFSFIGKKEVMTYTTLSFATVIQIMALTFYFFQERK